MSDTIDVPRELLEELLEAARECYNNITDLAGMQRYDRRMAIYQKEIDDVTALLTAQDLKNGEDDENHKDNVC